MLRQLQGRHSKMCEARALELKALANGRSIFLFWSGGIDSTLALHSLNAAGVKFTIIFDEESTDEYDELSADIINGKYPNITTLFGPQPDEYKTILDDTSNYMITGGSGDEIFGGEPNCQGEVENSEQDYLLYIPGYIIDSTNQYVERVVGKEAMMDLTVCEWRWAINFIYRYQQVQISSMYMLGLDMVNARDGHDAIHFYDNQAFNIWSMQNYKDLCGNGEDKMVAKKLIHEYDGYDRYLENKIKVCSMKKTRYRSGADYMGTGGDINTDVGTRKNNTYASTININTNLRMLKEGTVALALQKFDGV